MKFHVRDIEAAAKELHYEEPTHDLAPLLDAGAHDFTLPRTLDVDLRYYRAGMDLFFGGTVTGTAHGQCSRCLEDYAFPLDVEFSLVLAPHQAGDDDEDEDTDLSYYQGDEVDISPLLREQILLGLPTRALCREDCAGLCPQCGANRRSNPCDCHSEQGDPRLAILRTLKVQS